MDRYPSLGDHGLIGDPQAGALVTTDGRDVRVRGHVPDPAYRQAGATFMTTATADHK